MIERLGCFLVLVISIITIVFMSYNAKTKLNEKIPLYQQEYQQENNINIKNNESDIYKIVKQITEILTITKKRKTDFTSSDLTNAFAEILKPDSISKNSFNIEDLGYFEFSGDGKCIDKNKCYVIISKNKNKEVEKIFLYSKGGKYLSITPEN